MVLEWDPYTFSIPMKPCGTIHVKDLVDEKRLPRSIVRPIGEHRSDEIKPLIDHAGDVVAQIPRGLPPVVELFEARKPRDPAVIAEINGTIRYGEVSKGLRRIHILPGLVDS